MERAENEDVAVEHVVQRLTDQFPTVPAAVVEETVAELHENFDDAVVRDYVPVIVEHEAKAKLRSDADTEDSDAGAPAPE